MVDPLEKKTKKPDGPTCDRALLCPEEWVEPTGRKVIGEFHKDGLPKGLPGVEADLERFEEYWSSKGSVNMQGVYHMKGAPYLEEVEGSGDRQPQSEMGADTGGVSFKNVAPKEEPDQTEEKEEPFYGPFGAAFSKEELSKPQENMPEPESKRTINLAMIEIIAYALSRALFGQGVSIPLKKEGIVDAQVTLRNKDIIINTNQFYASIPDLAVWRVIYTHQGKPILEFGRGIPKGLKVYRLNALKLGLSLWMQNRAAIKAKEKLKKENEKGTMGKNVILKNDGGER
jgi:hypothetical protein